MHQAQTQGSGLGGGKVQRDIDAQVAITAEFGKQAAKSWGEYANGRFANAKNEEEARCWGPDGACRAGGHALLGGLGGGVAGAAGAGLTSVAAPHVAGYLIGQGVEPSTAAALTGLLAFGAGSAAGVAAGAGALNEAAQNNLVLINNFVNAAVQQGQRFGPGGLRLLDQASQALLHTCASSSVCMNLLPAAGVAWLAAQLTQEFEAKQPSLADQIPGYGGGYGPKPGPSHTGNDKTTNPIPGGTSTTYPAEGPKESGVVGGKPLDPQKPEGSILPGKPADPLPGVGPIFSENANNGIPRAFTSADPIVGSTATTIDKALPGVVQDVNVPIKNSAVGLSSDADIMLKNGDVIEVKSGGGKGATTQVINQTKIIGDSGEVIVYGPELKPSVINGIRNSGTKVFVNLDDLIAYIKSKGL